MRPRPLTPYFTLPAIILALCFLFLIKISHAQSIYASSFNNLLKDPQSMAIEVLSENHHLGKNCLNFLQNTVYRQGENLAHPIFDQISVPLKDYHQHYDAKANYFTNYIQKKEPHGILGLKNNLFYHYFNWGGLTKGNTNNNELRQMRKVLNDHQVHLNQSSSISPTQGSLAFDAILKLIRSSHNVFGHGIPYTDPNWVSGVLYTAAGPYSSKSYGNSMLTIQMSPQARIITTFESHPFNDHLSHNWKNYETQIIEDLTDKFPGLDIHCGQSNDGKMNLRKIMLLVFEDSKIDLIHYWNETDWFQVLRPDHIENLQVSFMKKKNQSIENIDYILQNLNKEQEILFKDIDLLNAYPYGRAPKDKTDPLEQAWDEQKNFNYLKLQ